MKAIVDLNGLAAEAIPLWEEEAPLALGQGIIDQPILTIHRPADGLSVGVGCIVAPGGGYRILASDHEGLQVAKWLNRIGVTAFVLRYRVGPKYHSSVSLIDGLRAVRQVRYRAPEYGIDKNRIGMLGFSAGGHLTVAVGTGSDEGKFESEDPVERMSSRPNFLVPVYAVTNGHKRGKKADEYTPTDESVNSSTPPTFLVHTHEDSIVPASQSSLFYEALLRHGVPAELHIFNDGEHGLGLMTGDPDVAQWTDLFYRWLRRRNFLSGEARVGLSGRVSLNGRAMGMVWITVIPENERHPIARVRIQADSDGNFLIKKSNGPVPGRHEVRIYHVSESRAHVSTGIYTMEDARVHSEFREIREGDELVLNLGDGDFRFVSEN